MYSTLNTIAHVDIQLTRCHLHNTRTDFHAFFDIGDALDVVQRFIQTVSFFIQGLLFEQQVWRYQTPRKHTLMDEFKSLSIHFLPFSICCFWPSNANNGRRSPDSTFTGGRWRICHKGPKNRNKINEKLCILTNGNQYVVVIASPCPRQFNTSILTKDRQYVVLIASHLPSSIENEHFD